MLTVVDHRFLDRLWPVAEPLLAPAVERNAGEVTLQQLRAQIALGGAHLLLWHAGDQVTGAGVMEFVQFPAKRVAHFSYFGGENIVTAEAFDAVKAWCVSMGASELRGFCNSEAHARLYRCRGCDEIYRVMRVTL